MIIQTKVVAATADLERVVDYAANPGKTSGQGDIKTVNGRSD